ncbi:MAG: hypothetical protein KAU02_05080 [Tenericutes bacterium]|nr:hypothetical protein [Mycoplasmatota bacterium]
MIDIHTHILPYVDDGSPDLQTSIDIIKSEINQGVTDIFVTPHYISHRGYMSSFEKNMPVFQELNEEVKRQGLNVKLYLGTEIYYNQKTLKDLADNLVKPLGDSKYLLVEFSLYKETEDIPEAINNLTAKGYIPVIAHPERYPYLDNINAYKYLKRMGAKIQINASSIIGDYGRKIRKFVFSLISSDLVDFVASDVHSFRTSRLLDAYNIISNKFSGEVANKLFDNREVFD